MIQREVGRDALSFAAALLAALREDPDVILVGEMRDAETGHLVFATLHTKTAAQSIDRIVDVFPPHQQPQARAQLAHVLNAVVTQQLLIHARGLRISGSPSPYPLPLRGRGNRNGSLSPDPLPLRGRGNRNAPLSLFDQEGRGEGGAVFTHNSG